MPIPKIANTNSPPVVFFSVVGGFEEAFSLARPVASAEGGSEHVTTVLLVDDADWIPDSSSSILRWIR